MFYIKTHIKLKFLLKYQEQIYLKLKDSKLKVKKTHKILEIKTCETLKKHRNGSF